MNYNQYELDQARRRDMERQAAAYNQWREPETREQTVSVFSMVMSAVKSVRPAVSHQPAPARVKRA